MLNEDWTDQYRRMLRSRARLEEVLADQSAIGSDEARDRLYHFFQDAFHLMDWLQSDPKTAPLAKHVDDFVRTNEQDGIRALALGADVANGTKHLVLDRKPWTPGPGYAEVLRQDAKVDLNTGTISHKWSVVQKHDVSALAGQIVAAWDEWLTDNQLELPAP